MEILSKLVSRNTSMDIEHCQGVSLEIVGLCSVADADSSYASELLYNAFSSMKQ